MFVAAAQYSVTPTKSVPAASPASGRRSGGTPGGAGVGRAASAFLRDVKRRSLRVRRFRQNPAEPVVASKDSGEEKKKKYYYMYLQ